MRRKWQSLHEGNGIIERVHADEHKYLRALVELADLLTAQLQHLLLRLVLDPYHLEQAEVAASDGIALREAEVVLADDLVLALMDVLPLELAVLVDDVIQRVDVNVGAETDQDVAHHLVHSDAPLNRGEAVGVDGVGDVEMEEVEFLLELVEGRLDEGWVREGEVLMEGRVKGNQQVQRLTEDQGFCQAFQPITAVVQFLHRLLDFPDLGSQVIDLILVAVRAPLQAVAGDMCLQVPNLRHCHSAKVTLNHVLLAMIDMLLVILYQYLVVAPSAPPD